MSFTPSPLDQDVREQIRQSTNIVELIGSYLQLRRQGRGYVALCPWHNDKRPSLQVNPQRQSWKCWVCDVGGDAFSFVMQREGVDFREALQILADRAGIELTKNRQPKAPPGSPQDKRTLYRAMQWAEEQFHGCLLHAGEAGPARDYLQKRSISAESIERFRLGFSPPGWSWLLDRARATEFSAQVLEAVGLCARSEKTGGYYDRFRDRVLFPIRDLQSRPIAFGGRILPGEGEGKGAKYINSPETRLFSKSDNLYGLDVARDIVANQREVVVVEGYTDTVIAHQFGVANAVAVLGTALGPRHIQILRRFADRIVLVLDGDEAGRRRTNEILELFLAAQVDVRILTLPQGLDPADFLLESGAEAFQELLEGAVDALQHKILVATEGVDLTNDTHRANQALEDILATIAKSPLHQPGVSNEFKVREDQVLVRLFKSFGVPELQLRSRLAELRRKVIPRIDRSHTAEGPERATPIRLRDIEAREVELLEILVAHPDFVPEAVRQIEVGQLKSGVVRTIYHTIHRVHDAEKTPDFGNILTELEDPQLKNIWVELDDRARAKAEDAQVMPRERLEGLIELFHFTMISKDRQQKLTALEQNRLSEEQALAELQSLITQERNRRGISGPMDG